MLHSEPETEWHASFLTDLFMACSPLGGMLPEAMLRHQAAMQQSGHRAQHPDADRRILSIDGTPIGRVAIDWSADEVVIVDIAVSPDRQASGIGSAVLSAMIYVADEQARRCCLTVLRDNPAARLYARLGFVVSADDGGPFVEMLREPRR